jgi:hypothetical protein
MPQSCLRSNQRRLVCLLGFAGVLLNLDQGCSPCAAGCTDILTVGMTRDFAEREARPAAALHTCDTPGVLAVTM